MSHKSIKVEQAAGRPGDCKCHGGQTSEGQRDTGGRKGQVASGWAALGGEGAIFIVCPAPTGQRMEHGVERCAVRRAQQGGSRTPGREKGPSCCWRPAGLKNLNVRSLLV